MLNKLSTSVQHNQLETQILKAEEGIVSLLKNAVSILSSGNYQYEEDETQTLVIRSLIDFRQCLRGIIINKLPLAQAISQLEVLIIEGKTTLMNLPDNQSRYRKILQIAVNILQNALESLPHDQVPEKKRKIILPAEILYQAQTILFPAERMLVTSGRHERGNVTLGANFDVTGDCSVGHVRADPQKLASALIGMDKSGSHLAFWGHSHPGVGIKATTPSYVDHNQYADWIKDYGSGLVAAIFVSDGHFRLWGGAIENKNVDIHLIGQGVKRISYEQIYKFE